MFDMIMKKTIIFDFDGVLVDAEQVNQQAAIKTFQDLGMPLTEAEITSILGRASRSYVPEFLTVRERRDVAFHQQVIETLRRHYFRMWPQMATIPDGLKEVLDALRARGKAFAIATTNLRKTVDMFFDKSGLRDYFPVIVTGDGAIGNKYTLAIRQCRVPPSEAIAVEDTATGAESANSAGLECIVIPTPYSPEMVFPEGVIKIATLKDMLNLEL